MEIGDEKPVLFIKRLMFLILRNLKVWYFKGSNLFEDVEKRNT
jgi:hypothetical protein